MPLSRSDAGRPARTLGLVTIGQTPRDDIVPELRALLPGDLTLVERGALDDTSAAEIQRIAPTSTGAPLVTRLRDGTPVTLGTDFLTPRVQACIDALAGEAGLILLLCTGSFPPLRSTVPLLLPERALENAVRAAGARHIGILTPGEGQLGWQLERWRRIAEHVGVEAASPYGGPDAVRAAARRLARAGAKLLVLDSLGYPLATGEAAADAAGVGALVAREALANAAVELLK